MLNTCCICGEKKEVCFIDEEYICEDCHTTINLYSASLEGYERWGDALQFGYIYETGIDKLIADKLQEIKRRSEDIETQKEALLRYLEEKIKSILRRYNKDEIFVALLAVKECIRRILINEKEPTWLVLGDTSTVNLLMKFAKEVVLFENHAMTVSENGYSDFVMAICLARRFNLIEENISLLINKDVKIEDICFTAIQTQETEKYFELYLKNGLEEKPEDYVIKNEILQKKLENENKTPGKILEKLNNLLHAEFGFAVKDCRLLSNGLLRMEFPHKLKIFEEGKVFEYFPVLIMEKTLLSDICGEEKLEMILETFSINRNVDRHNNAYYMELFCFYEAGKFIIFGNIDFAQTVSTFEKFLISGHFIDVYKEDFPVKMLSSAQNTLSKYFSVSVADHLYFNGYNLPMEKYLDTYIPRSEIGKIEVNGKNILLNSENKKIGDIDVLAVNKEKKEILLFELKFYKPAISAKDMLLKDRSLIEDKDVFRHIKEREDAISDNVDEVVKYVLGKEEKGYTVKSILLTARANYYGINEKEFAYLTWSQFIEKADRREI